MKRPRTRQIRPTMTRSSSVEDTTTTNTDTDDQLDASYETDLTEPEDIPTVRKRPRPNETSLIVNPELPDELEELYEDPLDDTGIDLSEIPEDFDKSELTILRRERIETRWKRYCAAQTRLEPNEPKWRDAEEALRQATNNNLYRFLGWCLKLKRGKEGRKLKGIHKSSSLNTDWKNLRGYYQKLTKIKIDDGDGSEVRRGMKYLVVEHGLDTQPKKKTPVYIEDVGPLNETVLSTQQKKFYLGFQRIQVCLFNSLALFTVHRRSALLSLQFKDLQISLQKDPRGGPPQLLVELTPEGCKKFLGVTKLTTFALPEVVYGPSLVICPHTLLFGVLFHARAFRNPKLRSKGQLRSLFISKGCQQLLVPFDPKKADWYIFCKTELVKGVPTIQWTQPMLPSAMSSLLVTFGEIRGWPGAFHAHQFRYGGGKVINESGWVSKEQRMLIMKHASPRTFLDHYHPLQIDTDMIRIICGLDPDVELMRAVTRQNRWQDPRRPRYLTAQQRSQIEDHPELEEARRNLSKTRARYDETGHPGLLSRVQQLDKEVKNTRKRLLRALLHQVRENFDEEQAFLDIEAQLSGTMVKEEDTDDPSSEDDMHPLLLHLLQSLLSYPISNSLEDEWNRRDRAADAVMQYCGVLEGGPLRGRPKRDASESVTPPVRTNIAACESPLSARDERLLTVKQYIQQSQKLKDPSGKPTQPPRACFQCFADETLPDDIRCRMFKDPGCVTRHFDARHLHQGPLRCNWCGVEFPHKMAFQRHAIDEHRVRSRWRCPDPANPGLNVTAPL